MHLLAARARLSPGQRTAALGLAAVLLKALAACSHSPAPESDAVSVEVVATPRPLTVGPARLGISIRDPQGRPLEPAAVELEANMTHPGMAPSFPVASPAGSGEWRADLELTMAGDWFVEVEVRLEDGSTVLETVELPGVRAR